MADAADKLVTPWECTGEDCGVSAVTATEMVNKFGHYVTAENPDVFTFFETCGACNNDVVGIRCVDCPESADTHEEAEIKFGEDYADKERQVRKGKGKKKTGLRCLECLEKFDAKEKSKNKKKPAPEPKKKNAKGAKRDLATPDASGDEDGGDDGEGDSKSGQAAESESKSPKKKAGPPPSPGKKTPRKTVAKKK
jgi:hypothetical protein